MKKIYLSFLLCISFLGANAQIAYDFAATSGTFTELVGGTNPIFESSDPAQYTETDEGYANSNPIGFTFNYNNVNYTMFHINSNGFISLGTAMTAGDVYWRNSTGLDQGPFNGTANNITATRPCIAPLWDDLDFAAISQITYLTSGTAGNRVLTVQWLNAKWNYAQMDGSVSFQVKLYEADGKIEFIYRGEAANPGSASASCGITAVGLGADNYISVNDFTTAATVSKTTHTSTISTKPATGLIFTFSKAALPMQDARVAGYTVVPPVGCHNTTQSVTVRVANAGSGVINANAVSVNLTSTGANATVNLTSTNATSIAVGATLDIVFTGINLNSPGATTLRAVSTLAADPNASNDTARVTVNTASGTSTFPVNESAENATLEFSWLRNFAGTNAWGLRTGGYRNADLTSNTNDSLYPQTGNRYYIFDSYNAPAGTRTLLHSNCFALPVTTAGFQYDISFWMSHDSSFATLGDSLYVNISTNRGQTWTRMAGVRRYDPLFTMPGWRKENINLAAYAGQTIMLGFEGVSKFGNIIGLDNITVRGNMGLPVTFVSFTGIKEGKNNILKWETANELNNKGFELMRSADGKVFSTIGAVGSLAADGNSSSRLNYKFVDDKVLNGTNYYQLKQIDKDGKTSLGNVVVLNGEKIKGTEISNIYPNPATVKLNVIITNENEEKVTLNITDLAGRVLSNKVIALNAGSNNIELNTSSLSSGTYLVKVIKSTNEIVLQKFVKQ